jgi:HPt (histidine-containing phosphotransfer) domain-containing protein
MRLVMASDIAAKIARCVGTGSTIAEVANLAHRMRGAAATIGGEDLRAVTTEIEVAAGGIVSCDTA